MFRSLLKTEIIIQNIEADSIKVHVTKKNASMIITEKVSLEPKNIACCVKKKMNEGELGFLFIESKGTVSNTSNKPRQQLLCFRIFLQGVRSQTRTPRAITVNNTLDTNMGKEVLKLTITFIIFERTDKLIFLCLDDFQDGDKNTHCRVNKFIKK